MNIHPRKQKVLDVIEIEPTTLDELGFAIIKYINNAPRYCKFKLNKTFQPIVLGLKWDISYSSTISNTHSSPVTGETNFSCLSGKPRSYPGFSGRLWVRYASDNYDMFGSEPINDALTYTGSGGGGSYKGPWTHINSIHFSRFGYDKSPPYPRPSIFSWDYKIFVDDWPLIKHTIEKHQTMAILKGKDFQMKHVFEWNDPEILLKDKEFIKTFG